MKKVLIGVLILIPIIIVASVLLTTNIISKNSYLPVDRVELNENYIEFSLDNGNTIDTLKATVYPRLAKNHNRRTTQRHSVRLRKRRSLSGLCRFVR